MHADVTWAHDCAEPARPAHRDQRTAWPLRGREGPVPGRAVLPAFELP